MNSVEDKAVIGIAPACEVHHAIGSGSFTLFFPEDIPNRKIISISGMPHPHRNITIPVGCYIDITICSIYREGSRASVKEIGFVPDIN